MVTPKLKEEIALKKFSLISPVINGQVDNQQQCGALRYSPKTLSNWLSEYRRNGFDALNQAIGRIKVRAAR